MKQHLFHSTHRLMFYLHHAPIQIQISVAAIVVSVGGALLTRAIFRRGKSFQDI